MPVDRSLRVVPASVVPDELVAIKERAQRKRTSTAQRLINLGVSAETLKVVLRHRDFATTEKFYGAIRSAQSAAREVRGKLPPSCGSSALVGGLVGGHEKAPRLSTDELRKLKAVLNSL